MVGLGRLYKRPSNFNVQYLLTIVFDSIIRSGVPVRCNERDISHRLFRLGKQGIGWSVASQISQEVFSANIARVVLCLLCQACSSIETSQLLRSPSQSPRNRLQFSPAHPALQQSLPYAWVVLAAAWLGLTFFPSLL